MHRTNQMMIYAQSPDHHCETTIWLLPFDISLVPLQMIVVVNPISLHLLVKIYSYSNSSSRQNAKEKAILTFLSTRARKDRSSLRTLNLTHIFPKKSRQRIGQSAANSSTGQRREREERKWIRSKWISGLPHVFARIKFLYDIVQKVVNGKHNPRLQYFFFLSHSFNFCRVCSLQSSQAA